MRASAAAGDPEPPAVAPLPPPRRPGRRTKRPHFQRTAPAPPRPTPALISPRRPPAVHTLGAREAAGAARTWTRVALTPHLCLSSRYDEGEQYNDYSHVVLQCVVPPHRQRQEASSRLRLALRTKRESPSSVALASQSTCYTKTTADVGDMESAESVTLGSAVCVSSAVPE